MRLNYRTGLTLFAILAGFATSVSVFAGEARSEEVFDRLDGKGPSGKRVDVIEWEGNLEVHVYPKGSLTGLSSKLDDREKGKKVMVIGYRFGKARPLIRRAILGVPFTRELKAFTDTSEAEFDKLAISNRDLPGKWKPFKLDPAPDQWYPDGDERNNTTLETPGFIGEFKIEKKRTPATVEEGSLNEFDF